MHHDHGGQLCGVHHHDPQLPPPAGQHTHDVRHHAPGILTFSHNNLCVQAPLDHRDIPPVAALAPEDVQTRQDPDKEGDPDGDKAQGVGEGRQAGQLSSGSPGHGG